MPQSASRTIIVLHPEAAAKPAAGTPCNGCGLCCAVEPCPLGMLLSGRRTGRCVALKWRDIDGRYHCDAAESPQKWLPVLPKPLASRLVLRWIAAGQGCDCSLDPIAETAYFAF